jgi:hypothetical protein
VRTPSVVALLAYSITTRSATQLPNILAIDWAAEQISKIDARRKGKDSVKKMERVFNGIEEDETQQRIGSCMNKTGTKARRLSSATSPSPIGYTSPCSPSSSPAIRALWRWSPPSSSTPHPDGSRRSRTSHLIRGKYLDKAYAKTNADCKELFKDMEHMTALAIMSGGKTNNGRIPIANYIAASPKGTHFLAD